MLMIFLVLLICYTLFVYYAVSKSIYGIKFPPRVAECPDYFGTGSDDKNVTHECYNNYRLGNFLTNKNCAFWEPSNKSLAAKCRFYKECNVGWDGLNDTVCNVKPN